MRKEKTEQLFIAAYDELHDSVFRHCYLRVSQREDALDITQETFTKVWDYLQRGKKVDNMKALIFKSANNLIIDWYRKKKPVPLDDEVALRLPDHNHAPNPQIEAEGSWAREKLLELEEQYRVVVEMRLVQDLGPKEIASILGESENVVSVRIHRGIKKLQKLVQEES